MISENNSKLWQTLKICILFFALISCKKKEPVLPISNDENSEIISAIDISSLPEILISNPKFYNAEGQENNFLDIAKGAGINTIRIRLWVNPVKGYSGFSEVKEFSESLKSKGFKTWLTLHYSDTWADPEHQQVPVQWQGKSFQELKDSVSNYTKKIVLELQPNYIQIGNEINSGFLHPFGHISNNFQGFEELMKAGISAVRNNGNGTKIILHFAGIEGSDWFFNRVSALDYDIIGLSFYPIWHGKSLDNLKNKLQFLSVSHGKKVMVAETAYPFTLQWNDWTNNIVGLNEQLILPEYPASPEGQRKFVEQIRKISTEGNNGIGFCYWGAELISWKGNQSSDASVWENQALFDFNNKALPALSAFKN